jgi:hypothetical protein
MPTPDRTVFLGNLAILSRRRKPSRKRLPNPFLASVTTKSISRLAP